MRIVLVSQEYPPTKHGGIGAQNYCKAQGLAARGHDIVVVAHSAPGHSNDIQEGRVRVIRVAGCDDRMPIFTEEVRWLTYSVRVAETLHQLYSQQPFDLVDFPEWGGEGYIYMLNRAHNDRVPVVVQLHGPLVMFAHELGWPDRESEFFRVGTHLERTSLRLAEAVYSSSRCSIAWCAEHYGLSSQDVPVIHTGVDIERFRPDLAPKEQRPTIVFVGKIVENKGVIELAEAAANLLSAFPDLQLWMIGGGPANIIQRLKQIAQRTGNVDFLQLKGFLSHEILPRELSRAHVFAAPSHYEGGPGFVYLEAMACGVPVIACSGSGAAEVVTDDKTGRLVLPRDVPSITEALRDILGNERRRRVMGAQARDYVVTEADSRVCLNRLENFYRDTVAQARDGAERLP